MKKTLINKILIVCVVILTVTISSLFVPGHAFALLQNDPTGISGDANLGATGGDANLGGNGGDSNLGGRGSDSNTQTPVSYLQNPLDPKFNTVGGIVNGFADIFTYLVILFAVLMIIYVGLRFVMAQGNMEELKTRKDQLLWLLVGVAIVIGARLLISMVINTLQATGVVSPSVINSAQNALK